MCVCVGCEAMLKGFYREGFFGFGFVLVCFVSCLIVVVGTF